MKPALRLLAWVLVLNIIHAGSIRAGESPLNSAAEQWRAEHRVIDLHMHIDFTTQHLARAVKIMDSVGIGVGINLSGGTVMPGPKGELSEFQRNKSLADTLFPGRFLLYMNLDYGGWDKPDFAERAGKQHIAARRIERSS
jgi:hypothetical protein